MGNRLIATLALACLVVVSFAAVASAEVITRAGASSKNRPEGTPTRWSGPPVRLDVCDPFNGWEEQDSAPLIAGRHYDVGEVWVQAYQDGPSDDWHLKVTYKTTGNWYLVEYHLYVGDERPGDAPGQYPYKGEHLDTQEIVVDGIRFDGGCVNVAAHAVVEEREGIVDLDEFADDLPECVDILGWSPAADTKAYFDIRVLGSDLMGDYYGWCVDTDNTLSPDFEYPAHVYSSYEDLPDGLIEFPENLDQVNWILNQEIVGTPSICGGDFTYGDVQRAIWDLVDDEQADGGLGPWDQCRVNEILCKAWINGHGFEPDCGDLVGVILVPVEYCGGPWNFQFIIIPVPTECDGGGRRETAWALAGDGFECGDVSGWGSYMQFCYDPQERGW